VTLLDHTPEQVAEAQRVLVRIGIDRPIHQLPSALGDVPEGDVWVHCEAGYRACIGASFLHATGRSVVAVNDEYERAARRGLPLDRPLAHVT
jgi:hydroxyacylglutathione hydrolase